MADPSSSGGLASLAGVYPSRNPELRRLSLFCYEAARNTIQEGSSGVTIGVDEHFIPRQNGYVAAAASLLEELKGRPVPDAFGMPDTQFPVDLSAELQLMTTGVGGAVVPLNEDLQLVTIDWMQLAVSLATCDSSGLRGNEAHYHRRRAQYHWRARRRRRGRDGRDGMWRQADPVRIV